MPAQYEAIRDKFIGEWMSTKSAKKHAAMIYNSKHPKNPVTRNSESKQFVNHVKNKMGKSYMKMPK